LLVFAPGSGGAAPGIADNKHHDFNRRRRNTGVPFGKKGEALQKQGA